MLCNQISNFLGTIVRFKHTVATSYPCIIIPCIAASLNRVTGIIITGHITCTPQFLRFIPTIRYLFYDTTRSIVFKLFLLLTNATCRRNGVRLNQRLIASHIVSFACRDSPITTKPNRCCMIGIRAGGVYPLFFLYADQCAVLSGVFLVQGLIAAFVSPYFFRGV